MPDRSFLDWPFLDDTHRTLVRDLEPWVAREIASSNCSAGVRPEWAIANGWIKIPWNHFPVDAIPTNP